MEAPRVKRCIATLGSHCALQLLKGAKEEGFPTLVVSRRDREGLYRRFPSFIDELVMVDSFEELVERRLMASLKEKGAILIPHGTFISELGVEKIEKLLEVPLFGNRWMLRWEADRGLKEKLMKAAGLATPRSYNSPEEVDGLAIAKLSGAQGGRGYFLFRDARSYGEKLARLREKGLISKDGEGAGKVYLQEYVPGVPVYLHYFFSPLKREVELMGIDRRYESIVDALGRIPAQEQVGLEPSYLVIGNEPLVLRESLLEEVYRMGERFVKASQVLVPPGMIGPFCLEGVYNEEGRFVAFEFSARIVAGTNLYIGGSPYSLLHHGEPISMGRRIAREIREGMEAGELEAKLLT